jgi:hypothetical protein
MTFPSLIASADDADEGLKCHRAQSNHHGDESSLFSCRDRAKSAACRALLRRSEKPPAGRPQVPCSRRGFVIPFDVE